MKKLTKRAGGGGKEARNKLLDIKIIWIFWNFLDKPSPLFITLNEEVDFFSR